ncbi:hypothetical protein LWI29_029389 [Acer saccharum]|uniref:C2H2-type domain-containing protein n=1 Tax=Acer saccharum TaxID=4024 RepID=A0AA39RIV2_ACESA|nr:hypothetical protein LWI29_029389 [Acer saccharum]KAK1555628.1 hypothetical protein Q3G72_029279 [Acer saccharum]
MATSSSSTPFFEDQNQQMKQQHSSTPTSSSAQPPAPPPQKKKRNQPGTPNPDAEVIALSPKTLMATNRFICEVCNKGFQREQNLQLHRRGHNLPWKLKQKTTKEVKRKVYLCPEPTCVHHDPSRALGDLTGIKKHFSRKHGEKKWKCEKCSKRYAVQSDWKAHSKTCGTREYRCDCGTLFSRRDSFITHRAFCDALAQESARHPPSLSTIGSHLYGNSNNMGLGLSQVGHQLASIKDQTTQSNDILRLGGGGSRSTSQFDHLLPPSIGSSSSFRSQQTMPPPAFFIQESNHNYHEDHQSQQGLLQNKQFHGIMQFPDLQNNTSNPPSGVNLINLNFLSNSSTTSSLNNGNNSNNNNTNLQSSSLLEGSNNLYSNSIMNEQISSGVPSLFSSSVQNDNIVNSHMSATALLQKAAQMGSTSSSNNTASLLRSFGSSSSSGSKPNFSGIFGSENDNNLQDLMNSFASGNSSSIFGGGSGGGEVNNAYTTTSGHAQENNTYGGFNANKNSMEPKLHQNLNISSGGSDRTTRDFLGVGQIREMCLPRQANLSEEEEVGVFSDEKDDKREKYITVELWELLINGKGFSLLIDTKHIWRSLMMKTMHGV